MSVWFCIPSARPVAEAQPCIDAWQSMGYQVAVFRDMGAEYVSADLVLTGEYKGYAQTVNNLAALVLDMDPECNWIVTGGDDTFPDQAKRADVIARECSRHFGTCDVLEPGDAENLFGTYGVMQPTGDRFADGSIDRIAGSPWMGREWCQRAHGGRGPLHPDFWHMFVDEAVMGAAMAQGVFWPRRDLTHFHRHFMRESADINSPAINRPIPPHLVRANSPAHWQESNRIFGRVQRGGFAECLPNV